MKKVRVVLAASAFLLAGAGVFASNLFAPVFYRASNPNGSDAAECSVVIPDPGCGTGSVQCRQLLTVNSQIASYRISVKQTTTSPCALILGQVEE